MIYKIINADIMITFVIILWAIGLIVLPLGRLYMSWQRHQNNEKFFDPDYIRRFNTLRRVLSISLCSIALIILLIFK